MKTNETSKYPEETFGLTSEKTTKELAIAWWNKLTLGTKLDFLAMYPVVGKAKDRVNNLTGREIEKIWEKETQEDYSDVVEAAKKLSNIIEELKKPNQKQFIDKPFRRGIVELSDEKCTVNYRFISEDTIEMYADDMSYIGETHYKSLIEEFIQPKKNQKQFKQFDEFLFRAYIDKFSNEDKLNALKVLFWSLNSEQKYHVIEIGIDKI